MHLSIQTPILILVLPHFNWEDFEPTLESLNGLFHSHLEIRATELYNELGVNTTTLLQFILEF